MGCSAREPGQGRRLMVPSSPEHGPECCASGTPHCCLHPMREEHARQNSQPLALSGLPRSWRCAVEVIHPRCCGIDIHIGGVGRAMRCPHPEVSKSFEPDIQPGNNWLRTRLRESAWAEAHSRESYLGAVDWSRGWWTVRAVFGGRGRDQIPPNGQSWAAAPSQPPMRKGRRSGHDTSAYK